MLPSSTTGLAWADLPSCGLGNKLLIWGKAFAFAQSHQIPLMVSGWSNRGGLRTWLKGGGWRRYQQDFSSLGFRDRMQWNALLRRSQIVDEPNLPTKTEPGTIYRFHQMTHWSDYFADVKPIRQSVCRSIPAILTNDCQARIAALPTIDMAVHVRMGDFRPLRPGENFAQVGQVRTPLEYFVQIIENTRKLVGKNVRVTLFSDGKDADLQELLRLPNLQRAAPASAICDIYGMVKSKLIVCAAGSTFSYWSVFLGQQPAIIHRDHIHQSIRPKDMGESIFEGAVGEELELWPELLRRNVLETKWS